MTRLLMNLVACNLPSPDWDNAVQVPVHDVRFVYPSLPVSSTPIHASVGCSANSYPTLTEALAASDEVVLCADLSENVVVGDRSHVHLYTDGLVHWLPFNDTMPTLQIENTHLQIEGVDFEQAGAGAIVAHNSLMIARSLRFANGEGPLSGGIVLNTSHLYLTNSSLEHNTAPQGAAIYALDSSIEVRDSSIDSNDSSFGGAIMLDADGVSYFHSHNVYWNNNTPAWLPSDRNSHWDMYFGLTDQNRIVWDSFWGQNNAEIECTNAPELTHGDIGACNVKEY